MIRPPDAFIDTALEMADEQLKLIAELREAVEQQDWDRVFDLAVKLCDLDEEADRFDPTGNRTHQSIH